MLPRALGLLLCAASLAACGAAQETSVDEFSGAQREVAQLVADLSSAAADGDAAEICSARLTTQFADRLKAGTRTCTQELEQALGDADDFSLEVQEVVVTGARAAARVRDGEGRSRVLDAVRVGTGWRLAGIRPAG